MCYNKTKKVEKVEGLFLFSGCSFLLKYRGTFLDENFRKEYVEKNKDLNELNK